MRLEFADENSSPLQQQQAQPRRELRKLQAVKPKLRRRQVLVQVMDSLLLVKSEEDAHNENHPQVCQIPFEMFNGHQFQKQV
ncbi:hypothetical protein BASA81_000872 [Batrachochytrium salamandrivorans]|nr:hypothetical protein BASA81_000872 [Batrachochytrium salamandrivorans]